MSHSSGVPRTTDGSKHYYAERFYRIVLGDSEYLQMTTINIETSTFTGLMTLPVVVLARN
jgi:hypothetical protein